MNRYARLLLSIGLAIASAHAARLFADESPDKTPTAKKPVADAAKEKTSKEKKDEDSTSGKFLRVIRNDKGTVLSMETSIARYIPTAKEKAGTYVDLISAVHIGEKDYYTKLNKAFQDYDVVLYELVAPEGTRIPKGGGERRGFVSGIQGGMKDLLELDFQLEQIDYQKENLVHADMSPEQFSKEMEKRGETMLSMLFRMMGQSMAMQSEMQAKGQSTDVEMLFALFSNDRALKLKRAMAAQFENMDMMTQTFGGPDGSIIIEGRNQAALKVLKSQLADGKKKIGIFYGGGHMKDLEKQLLKDFGLKFEKESWLEAWSMPEKVAAVKDTTKKESVKKDAAKKDSKAVDKNEDAKQSKTDQKNGMKKPTSPDPFDDSRTIKE